MTKETKKDLQGEEKAPGQTKNARRQSPDFPAAKKIRVVDLTSESGIGDQISTSADRPAVAALGNFDGVHIAHRRLMQTAVAMAGERGSDSAVFTFRTSKGNFLTDFDEKLRRIEAVGIDCAYVADFDRLKSMSPRQFVDEILVRRMKLCAVVCGYNFRFGSRASGDTETLRSLCGERGIETVVLPPIMQDGVIVSSTEIRSAVRSGEMERVTAMLGSAFALHGKIAHGRTVGRQNDCPTLNLELEPGSVCPKYGVYFTRCLLGQLEFASISNIGVRPTFSSAYGDSEVLCEVHLLGDLSPLTALGELYGLPIRVELDHFCRPERKFESPEELYRQISSDILEASRYYHL
ncbi:MAG: riboflavin biosynthesis protein RibF [Eubacteriales bacterium]